MKSRKGILAKFVGIFAAGAGSVGAEDISPSPAGMEVERQTYLEEVVVTAQRRSESLQDVPIAVSAITANDLRNTGIEATKDLPQIVPSVQFTRSGPSGLFFIRGVGTSHAATGEEGANAFYVDDVYMGDLAQTISNFNNIERVEVIKGPQGTLFGRNATGGLIHIITREPGDEALLDAEIGYSNYDTYSGRIYAATPLSDKVSMDIALTGLKQRDGWGHNVTLGKDTWVQEYWGARTKMVIQPNDDLKLILSSDYYESKDNIGLTTKLEPGTVGAGGFTGPSGFRTTASDLPMTKQEVWGLSLTAEMNLGFASLHSISAYRKNRSSSLLDVDAGPLPLVTMDFEAGANTFQQEFRLSSIDTESLSWQIGAFYLRSEPDTTSDFLGAAFTGAGLARQEVDSKLKTDSYAIFGEGTYSVTPATQLTAGLRYTADRRDYVASQMLVLFDGATIPGGVVTVPSGAPLVTPGIQDTKLRYDELTWRLALRQEITDDINAYASINRGFKAGSYSMQSPLNDPFMPQTITAYEMGLKAELFDRILRLNVSVYHYDIDDYQVQSAAIGNPGSPLVLNAATVKVDGLDVEFEAAPTADLRVFGGFTWLDSRFDKFGGPGQERQAPITYPVYQAGQGFANSCMPAAAGSRDPGLISGTTPIGGTVTCLGNVSGNQTPNAPRFTGSLGASYYVQLMEGREVRLSALYSYNDGAYFESDNIVKQGSYNLFNASVEYRSPQNLGIEVWGRNLTNEEYAVQKITVATGVNTALGAPRTFGITLKYSY